MPLGLSDRVLRCALSKTPVFVFYALLQFFYRKSFAGAILLFASWVCLPFLRPLQNGFTLLLLLLGVATFMGIMSKERRDFDGRRIEKVITRRRRRRYKRSGSVTCPLDDNYRLVVYRGGVDRGGHNRTTKNMTERLFEKVALVVGGGD